MRLLDPARPCQVGDALGEFRCLVQTRDERFGVHGQLPVDAVTVVECSVEQSGSDDLRGHHVLPDAEVRAELGGDCFVDCAGQMQRLADESGRYRSLVLLLGVGGLRWGEAAVLRVSDVDFLRRRIELHRNAV